MAESRDSGSEPPASAVDGPQRGEILERAGGYRLLAELFARQPDDELLALASSVPALAAHATAHAAATYTHVFVLNAYPFASVYLDPGGEAGGERAGLTRGVLEALGLHLEAGADADHLAVQLDALAALLEREAAALGAAGPADAAGPARARARHAQRVLLAEHLLPWAPVFLDAVARVDEGLYRAAAALTRSTLVGHAAALFDGTPLAPADAPPDAADVPLEKPGTPASTLDRLTLPYRSGLFLSRADLSRIGGELGLPLRFGGRPFMLESLARAAVQLDASAGLTAALERFTSERRAVMAGWAAELPALAPLWRRWLERLDATLAELHAPSELDGRRPEPATPPAGAR
jgi:TorA maturation chaperone TorD